MAKIHLQQELGYPLVMTEGGYEFTSPGFPSGSLVQGGNRTTTINATGFSQFDQITARYTSDGTNVTFHNITYRKGNVVVLEVEGVTATLAEASSAAWRVGFDNSGDDLIYGYTDDDVLNGGLGNDFFVGWAGDDMIFGGAGTDTAAFNGSRADFIFAKNVDGSVQITDKSTGFSGSDTVWGVEFFQFDDGTFSFDTLFPPPPPPPTPHDRIVGGKGNDRIHGWDGDDTLYGGNGKDYLYGDNGNDRLYGGQHKDVMYGGAGNDVFVLNSKPSKTNVDTIKDFNPTYDAIWLDNKYFKVGSKGTEAKPVKMSSKMFWTGTKAHDKDDRIIHDKKSGVLYYDADGTGPSAQVKMAVLAKNQKVSYHDFYVV